MIVMKRFLLLCGLLVGVGHAQVGQVPIPAEDKKVADAQALDIFRTLRAVNFEAREVVFPIYAGGERVAYGVSIGDSRLLTKASEVMRRGRLFTIDQEEVAWAAQLSGFYAEHDLAVLSVPGLQAPAVKWANAENLEEGAFLTAIRPDGEAQAMGVLSVQERSLKQEDQGFLGVGMAPAETGPGIRVESVEPKSAAEEVGIRAGDRIVKVDDQVIRGMFELSTKLRRLKKGDQPTIQLLRGKQTIRVVPTLKERNVREGRSSRLDGMDRMSGTQSRVRGNFESVMQSDMELEKTDAGLPVVDLEGRIVGMVIARAGRISTLILPGDELEAILAEVPQREAPVAQGRGQARFEEMEVREKLRREKMRRELEAMRRMMENLQRELEGR